ncbi:hypothetical protein Tco_1364552 [Tanacetum coccineum]
MAPKAPKRITRSNPATTVAPATTDTTTTPATVTVTDAQLKALIDQGVAEEMSHSSGNFGKILNEPSVETSMTEKTLNTLDGGGMRLFPEESDKVERYVGGLPDMIHGSIVASRPKTMQEAIEITNELIDKKINTIVE